MQINVLTNSSYDSMLCMLMVVNILFVRVLVALKTAYHSFVSTTQTATEPSIVSRPGIVPILVAALFVVGSRRMATHQDFVFFVTTAIQRVVVDLALSTRSSSISSQETVRWPS